MQWIVIDLVVFLVSVCLSGIIIPQILLISFRKKLFDMPNERKIHTAAVPKLGGLAFMPSIVFSLCLVCGALLLFGKSEFADDFATAISISRILTNPTTEGLIIPLCLGLCSLMMMYLVGIADDIIGLKYSAKFVAQIFAAILLASAGVRIDSLHGMLGIYELSTVASWSLTIFLVVFIINAINLIDGIDGLASGLSGFAMIFYGLYFWASGHIVYSLIAFASLGTLVPFFYYNVFGKADMGKKIFMGETGSSTTGLLLSFLALELSRVGNVGIFSSNELIIAFAPLAVPCLDVVRVFFHRVVRGHSPFLADRTHIHHKLLALGMTQGPAMLTIIIVSAVWLAFNLAISPAVSTFWILIIDIALWAIINVMLTRAIHRREKATGLIGLYD